jgi:hypothetical protein
MMLMVVFGLKQTPFSTIKTTADLRTNINLRITILHQAYLVQQRFY